jgi:hypothetical protein
MDVPQLTEGVGKAVGRTGCRPEDYDRLVDAAESLMPRLPFPRGVFRFRSHEEANAWMDQYILKAARAKVLARRVAAT